MHAFYLSSCIVVSLLYGLAQSATWSADSPLDNQQLYACVGNNVTFAWKCTLDEGEELGEIQWFYNGQSQELVAIFTRGIFSSMASFSQRVSWVENAELTLSQVMVPDSGNYSVVVTIHGRNGALHTLRRTLVVIISENMVTTDGTLHVVQDPNPVYNSVTDQWLIQLQCGHFIFQYNPPVNVEWTTPSGHVYNSTSFRQGEFYFHLPMPVETGNYVCSIPAHLAARECLHGDSPSRGAVRVDSVEARLLLLEKENSDLKHKLATSMANYAALQNSHNQLSATAASLQTTNSQLSVTTTNLMTRVGTLESAQRNQVAFHAKGLPGSWVDSNTPLVFNDVIYNQGYAYSPSSGYFTAPYSGLYVFFAKTSTSTENTDEEHDLMVDSDKIDEGFSVDPFGVGYGFPSPVHGVIHLTQGQRVYVRCRAGEHLWTSSSSFTGFLLSRDL